MAAPTDLQIVLITVSYSFFFSQFGSVDLFGMFSSDPLCLEANGC